MIAKGLDLPAVTLVGVVSADIALLPARLPRLRAHVPAAHPGGGRAGRGERPGRVLVQTFNPEHFCIQAAARHDYGVFMEAELSRARTLRLPTIPPLRQVHLRARRPLHSADRGDRARRATGAADRGPRDRSDGYRRPSSGALERLRGRYRWHVILRAPDPLPMLHELTGEDLPPGWSVDVDPTGAACQLLPFMVLMLAVDTAGDCRADRRLRIRQK